MSADTCLKRPAFYKLSTPTCLRGYKKQIARENIIVLQSFQSAPCTCSPININMENVQKPLGLVPPLSDKVVAFLFLSDTSDGRQTRVRKRRWLRPIVSPDLQRATNTQPDRERNCSENAPSCVITARSIAKRPSSCHCRWNTDSISWYLRLLSHMWVISHTCIYVVRF